MIEMVQAFIQSVNERKHVLLLIENVELTVDLIMEEEIITLLLKNGRVMIVADVNKNISRYRILGEPAKIKQLFEGKEKLRALLNRGELKFSASFRTILLLEAFFYLGKADLILAKIS